MRLAPTPALLALLGEIAREAGAQILDVYARADHGVVAKADASPLTEADLRADAVIRRGLEAAMPGCHIWSEESRSAGEPGPAGFLLVDPLDGTREFMERNGEFTVNIALVQGGRAVAGVVFAPVQQALYLGAAGLGAWREDAQGRSVLGVRARAAGEPLRVIGSRSHRSSATDRWIAALPVAHEFVAAGSSLKFCRLAEGAADVYPRMEPTAQWDTAAGQAVLEAAGGTVKDAAGEPLRYGPQRATINPDFLALGRPGLELPPLR